MISRFHPGIRKSCHFHLLLSFMQEVKAQCLSGSLGNLFDLGLARRQNGLRSSKAVQDL